MRAVLWMTMVLAVSVTGLPAQKKVVSWDLFRERQYEKALAEFKRDRRLFPKNAPILDGMGWCEFFLENYDAAEEWFDKALAADAEYKWSKQGKEAVQAARRRPLDTAASLLSAGRYGEARQEYQRIRDGKTTAPRSANVEAWAGEGWCLYHLGNYRDAMKAFRRALKERQGFPDAYRGIGYAEYRRGRHADAAVALKLSFRDEPDHYEARLTAGWCQYEAKQYREAIRQFQHAVGVVDGPWGAWKGIGWSYQKLDEEKRALQAFKKAVELSPYAMDADLRKLVQANPDWRELLNDVGWSALRGNLASWALSEFQGVLASQKNDASALRGISFAWFRLGYYQASVEAAALALKRDGRAVPVQLPVQIASGPTIEVETDVETLRSWAELRLGRYDSALSGFRKVLSRKSSNVDARSGEGWTLYTMGDMPQAEKAFEQALKLQQGYPDAASGAAAVEAWRYAEYNAAWASFNQGSYKAAVVAFEGVLADNSGRFPDGDRPLAHAGVGWSKLYDGDNPGARSAFEQALKQRSGLGTAHKGLGTLFLWDKKYGLALARFEDALKDQAMSADLNLLVALGNCRLELDRHEAAMEVFQKALEVNSGSAAALGGLAWSQLGQLESVEARLVFERGIRLGPDIVDTPKLRKAMVKHKELWKLHGTLAWAWFVRGSYDKAEADFRAALKRDSQETEARRGLGLTLLRKGQIADGQNELKSYFARAERKENPWGNLSGTLSEWAWTLYRAEEYTEAANVFSRLMSLHAGEKQLYADPFDGLGWCYLKQGRLDAARRQFLQAISITPRYESSLKGLETIQGQEARR